MEFLLLGVNTLLLLAVWRFMIKRTVLDHTRDKLFDLRDEVRSTFVSKNWDLSAPAYKKLRDLLNGHLRFTEDYSIWKVLFLNDLIGKNAHLKSEIHEKFEKTFTSSDPDQLAYMHTVRKRALKAVMEFSVFGSGLLMVLTVVFTPFMLLLKILNVMGRGFDAATEVCERATHNIGKTTASVMSSVINIFSSRLITSDWLEPYSYKIGSTQNARLA